MFTHKSSCGFSFVNFKKLFFVFNIIDPKKIADATKKASESFKQATGKNITDVIFKKQAGKTTDKTTIDESDLAPVDDETANKVATSAIATGSGVDSKTIKEIQAKSGKGILAQFNNLSTTKKLLYGGGGLAIIGFAIYKFK